MLELIPKTHSIEATDKFWDNFESQVKSRTIAIPGDFYGHYLPEDRFYFGYKDEPYIRNSFKTVMYGKVTETEIKYRFGKDPFSCLLMIAIYLIAIINSIHFPLLSNIQFLGLMFVCMWIPMHIYSKNSRDQLYQALLDMIDQKPMSSENHI